MLRTVVVLRRVEIKCRNFILHTCSEVTTFNFSTQDSGSVKTPAGVKTVTGKPATTQPDGNKAAPRKF
jgi:hypothetical protein